MTTDPHYPHTPDAPVEQSDQAAAEPPAGALLPHQVPPGRPVSLWQRPALLLTLGGVAAALLVLIAIAYGVTRSLNSATRLESAKETCAPHSSFIRLGDGGTSLIITGAGAEERSGASITQVACILAELDVPDSVISQIDGTRALDGRQHASWDGISASWTYHPDDGLNMILQEER